MKQASRLSSREPGAVSVAGRVPTAASLLSFSPWPLRPKKRPTKREIRRLALSLRDAPRPEVLAVLASCRRDAHDEDRAWALKVLLG